MSSIFDLSSLSKRIKYALTGIDLWLLLCFFLLATIGMFTMYSSSLDHFDERFFKHGRNILLALMIMLALSQVPPKILAQVSVPLYCVGVALLVAVIVFGVSHKGAQRWLKIGIEIQPSEILKIALPMMLAWWFHKYSDLVPWQRFSIAIFLLTIPVALILKQPDLGTAILVACAGATLLFFAGLNWSFFLAPFVALAIVVAGLISFEDKICADGVQWHLLHDYQKHRVCTMLNPKKDPLGKGFHVLQGEIAIGAGGLTGRGFLQGTQTHLEFVPERTTDFIFAAYAEEFGFVGNLVLLAIFLSLILRSLAIAYQAKTIYSRLLASSMGLAFLYYLFINIGMVIGILPVVGVPLPFISYGGTAMVVIGFAMGILFSISRDNYLVQKKLKQQATLSLLL